MKPRAIISAAILGAALLATAPATAQPEPAELIEAAVRTLLDEFTAERQRYEDDKRELFALVDRVAVPLFDLKRIAKLVLARNWRTASAEQRKTFADEFKKLLIGTYATALFQYTGEEAVRFSAAEITERKGRQFAKVKSEVMLRSGPPIVVEYSLLLGKDERWKIYNLSIAGLNMITNYRNTYGAAVNKLGLDGLIESMQESNAKNF